MKSNWFHKLWRQQREEELDAEIRNHLDDAVRQRITRGESPDEARANALREFGNESLVNEVTRAVSKNARWRLRAVRARMGAAAAKPALRRREIGMCALQPSTATNIPSRSRVNSRTPSSLKCILTAGSEAALMIATKQDARKTIKT